jgi:hypothetical protein
VFAELIAESFYSMADITWDLVSSRAGLVVAHFRLNDIEVEVRFEERGQWTVSFEVLRGASKAIYTAFHIFNGVFQAVEEFLETRNPGILVFATKRQELADIYELYLRREQGRIAALGYRLEPVSKVDPYREYTLLRITPSKWN